MKVTGTLNAWVTEYGMQGFMAAKMQGDGDEMVDIATYLNPRLDMADEGYTKVGTATIELEIFDDKTVLANAVEALKAEKSKVLAEAQAKATRLDEKIQNLLAITHEPTNTKDSSNIPF